VSHPQRHSADCTTRIEISQRLGKHRWVVERTFAWINRFRRLTIRYERRADIHLAFTTLACALICMNQVRRFCSVF
jgi:transposase